MSGCHVPDKKCDCLSELEKRLDCLGKSTADILSKHLERIIKLEEVFFIKFGKIPHKCPICKGHGVLGYPEVLQDKCEPCEGTGVIYG